jgi:hypothetical protein
MVLEGLNCSTQAGKQSLDVMNSDSMLEWVSENCVKSPKVGGIHEQRCKRVKSDKKYWQAKLI